MMREPAWTAEFPGAVTVCNARGIILEMNDQAALTFADDGGKKLIGSNLLECHPEAARTKIEEILRDRLTNVYTIEKAGKKKLIYQAPWYENGECQGLVELSLPLPAEMPHFKREG
jgi:hypothetical protein